VSRLTAALGRVASALSPGRVIDGAIAMIAPRTAVSRALARRALGVLGRYEAAKPGKQRKLTRDNSTGEVQVARDAATCRAMARHFERNHDVVKGALDVLVRNVVGPDGISIEPQPRTADDDISDDFARTLLNAYRDWSRRPEVTHTLDWAECQQMAARSWLRDGEMFAQLVEGTSARLDHGTQVPLSLELLEADLCPLDYNADAPWVEAGIERNDWGRPLAFYFHRQHPGGIRALSTYTDLKRVPANRMLHLAVRDRLSGLRGISQFASAITRFEDIKDYEESERIAARISAAIAAYVHRDKDMDWSAPTPPPGQEDRKREIALASGSVFDELLPGEDLKLLNPSRPNPGLDPFVKSQLHRAARGSGLTYSGLSGNYDGTYSAQRQELIEGWIGYRMLTRVFVARFVRPVWEHFVDMAIASRQITVPAGVRPETIKQAAFRGPAMPWIDPAKEAQALRLMVRSGFTSAQSVIAERGGLLQDTYEQLARERRLADELGLTLESDARTRGSVPGTANPDGDPEAAGGDSEGGAAARRGLNGAGGAINGTGVH
jgi:lambda family phage portal protein